MEVVNELDRVRLPSLSVCDEPNAHRVKSGDTRSLRDAAEDLRSDLRVFEDGQRFVFGEDGCVLRHEVGELFTGELFETAHASGNHQIFQSWEESMWCRSHD